VYKQSPWEYPINNAHHMTERNNNVDIKFRPHDVLMMCFVYGRFHSPSTEKKFQQLLVSSWQQNLSNFIGTFSVTCAQITRDSIGIAHTQNTSLTHRAGEILYLRCYCVPSCDEHCLLGTLKGSVCKLLSKRLTDIAAITWQINFHLFMQEVPGTTKVESLTPPLARYTAYNFM
jgi:hypothetical protein